MNFPLVSKSVTLNGEMVFKIFCVIILNLVVSGAHSVKVVDKAITMDNLRLLCLVVNVCRGTARRSWSKLINSRLNAQYLPRYRPDKKSVPTGTKIGDLE